VTFSPPQLLALLHEVNAQGRAPFTASVETHLLACALLLCRSYQQPAMLTPASALEARKLKRQYLGQLFQESDKNISHQCPRLHNALRPSDHAVCGLILGAVRVGVVHLEKAFRVV